LNPILLYSLCALGAIGVGVALPRRGPNPQIIGAVIGALAGGLAITVLSIVGFRATGELPNIYFYIFSVLALGAALRVITHPKPVYAALYFILSILATAGLFLILSAEFMAFALIIVYAGAILITYLFVIMLATQAPDEAELEVLAEYDTEAREPIAATVAGFILLAVLTTLMFRGTAAMNAPKPLDSGYLMAQMPLKIERALQRAHPELGDFSLLRSQAEGVTGDQYAIDVTRREATVQLPSGKQQVLAFPEDLEVTNIEQVGFNLLADHPGAIEIAGVILLMAMLGAVVLSRKQVQLDEDAKARAAAALAAEFKGQHESLGIAAPGTGGVSGPHDFESAEVAGGAR
jgi:NADH-quinone oxidoreductase subunit J